jgi:hypothetical protein
MSTQQWTNNVCTEYVELGSRKDRGTGQIGQSILTGTLPQHSPIAKWDYIHDERFVYSKAELKAKRKPLKEVRTNQAAAKCFHAIQAKRN